MRRTILLIAMVAAALLLASGVALAAKPLSNTAKITINDATLDVVTGERTVGKAIPYPSEITVSGRSGTITDVNLQLTAYSHTCPDDVDVLLVGPGGEEATVMSDVGGDSVRCNTPVRNKTLVLDDEATNSLPDESQLGKGTFKPTNAVGNDVSGDVFPAPAPAPSGGSALSAFDGTNANGTWRLYVVDDAALDTGQFERGWALTIQTA